MIVIGLVCLVLGVVTGLGILWTIGIICLVVGLILLLAGYAGHPLGGRQHWWLCAIPGRELAHSS
jgi:hypothetical protein